MKNPNVYALVHPCNAFRILNTILDEHKIQTDVTIKATAHAPSILTHREIQPEIDASYIITSQPTLVFHGRQWLKRKQVIDKLNRLQIPEVPLQQIALMLPSTYDGERHTVVLASLNTHSRMFKKMAKEGYIPNLRLLEIHRNFMKRIQEQSPTYRHLKASPMIMVDVNPGKEEMFNKDFVLGLRQPFMQKVVTTTALWKCVDYEVI